MRRCIAAAMAAVGVLSVAAPAAQAQSITPPPIFPAVDGRGVDLVRGTFHTGSTDVVIGQPGAGGLSYSWQYDGLGSVRHNHHLFVWPELVGSEVVRTFAIGFGAESFTLTGQYPNQAWVSREGTGSTLVGNTYTKSDGAKYVEDGNWEITYPNGEIVKLHYQHYTHTYMEPTNEWPWEQEVTLTYSRLQAVTNNYGYQLHFEYASDTQFDPAWDRIVSVRGVNMAVDWCDPLASACSGLTQSWPVATYADGWRPTAVTDSLNRTTQYSYDVLGRMVAIQYPGSASPDVAITYHSGDAYWRVHTLTAAGVTATYAYSDSGDTRTTTVTDPAGTVTVVSQISTGLIASVTDALGRTTSYQYDGYGRPTRVTQPEGNYADYAYDARGNVTAITQVAKPGSGLGNIAVSAAYPAACFNPLTCNKPESVTDARGYRTDYTYDTVHGGLLTATSPAPSGGAPVGAGVRPQTRYAYGAGQAHYRTSAGGYGNGAAIHLPTGASSCVTAQSCAGTADETVSSIAYPPSNTPNNLLPLSTTSAAGDGSLIATTSYAYDWIGNLLSADGPLAGAADTTVYKYDAARQVIGAIGPDPDGAGPLSHRAARVTYNGRGQATATERGVTGGQSDGHFAGFTPLARSETVYDAHGRAAEARVYDGASSTILSLTQQTYDAAGRPDCIALRMNAAMFGGVAPSCSLGPEGAQGADRVGRTVRDAAGQVTQLVAALGTAQQQNTATTTYSLNGKPLTVTDARGYRTTYDYDGHDRLAQIRYPDPAATGTSSFTDYEAYTYDAAGNVLTARTRAGQTFAYAYDNLNRVTFADAPGADPDTSTAYDHLGRVTQTTDSNGVVLTYGYDALGRTLSEGRNYLGTVSYQYDAAGHLTRIAWPDGFWVSYAYDLAGSVTAIHEYGSTLLAAYAYDDLGRRTALARGNGTATYYAYDGASRLTALTHDLAGFAHDQAWTYAYNSASQAAARTRGNAAYDWQAQWAGTRAYAHDGLSRTVSLTGVSPDPAYDANGNMGWDGAGSYAYDASNRMTGAAGGVAFYYDPTGQLMTAGTGGAWQTWFLYAGSTVIAEHAYGGGAVLRRYVPGPGMDEPVVWYEGATNADRRWLHADERGSVVAVTDGIGAVAAINLYDEYGAPAPSNLGRFQYTGQMWLPEVGLYHYKARAYNPRIGRFMQPDPIGYADGMNLYAYAGNDPINRTDPTGLCYSDGTGGCIFTDSRVVVTGERLPAVPWGFMQIWAAQLIDQQIQSAMALIQGLNGSPTGTVTGPLRPGLESYDDTLHGTIVYDCNSTAKCERAISELEAFSEANAFALNFRRAGFLDRARTLLPGEQILDIRFGPPGGAFGKANAIGSVERGELYTWGNNWLHQPVVSHEFGHILGLYNQASHNAKRGSLMYHTPGRSLLLLPNEREDLINAYRR